MVHEIEPRQRMHKGVVTVAPSSQKTNVTYVSQANHISVESLDAYTTLLFEKHKETCLSLCGATYRMYLEMYLSSFRKYHVCGSGQATPVAPNLWMSVRHAVELPGVSRRSVTNSTLAPYEDVEIGMPLSSPLKIDYDYLLNVVKDDREPISGKVSDFHPFDLAFITGTILSLLANHCKH